jgi:flagellar biosynthesis GTPase FlhF
MVLKKFFGTTIQEALKAAKEQLGQQVILIESVAPQGEKPASVTVMLDEKLPSTQPVQENSTQDEFRNVFYKRSDIGGKRQNAADNLSESDVMTMSQPMGSSISPSNYETYGEIKDEPVKKNTKSDLQLTVPKFNPNDKSTLERKTATVEEAKKKSSVNPKKTSEATISLNQDDFQAPMSRRGTPLIEVVQTEVSPENNGYVKEISVSREISAIQRRLEQLESMLSETLISASLDYASHAAFQQLLQTGIRATTISMWFKKIMDTGLDPFDDREPFMYELAKMIRKSISMDYMQPAQPNLVFVGPSGSGKTTLIMKLASNAAFFGGKKVALVSVIPRNSTVKYSILELYAKDAGLPYFTVNDGIDVSKLMAKLVEFDHVLFDTPSISLEKKTAFREYWKIRQILASVMPVEVHFVVNATMENYYFREAYATNHPLQPDYVAITHLDETNRWGHLIPFLKTLGVGVRYISQGAEIPDSIQAFSPTWFAEQVLSSAG